MSTLFREILYKPIFNLLVGIYNIIPGNDFGVAIVVLTVLVRVVFMPWSIKATRSQKKLAELQPKLKTIQEKYKNDKAAQAQATMALYKENQISPISGCLPLLVQLPFLIALYRAFLNGFKPESLDLLYGFVNRPEVINNISLGFIDLASRNLVLVFIAAGLQFIQSKLSLPPKSNTPATPGSGPDLSAMNRQMLYFFPVMIIIIGWNLPAGLVLYWAVTTLFSVFEQWWVRRAVPKTV
ncbi:MAG: YidC/Oxa1 family membrane protein insertase [bacterium]|nr:YidC/Oxa1 family membrane protein insertase [bacterium]